MPDSPLQQVLMDREEKLRNMLGSPDPVRLKYPHLLTDDTMPEVPHAPPFRQEPQVVGSPEFARTVDSILQFAPELRGHVNKVQVGPTGGVIDMLINSKMSPYDFGNSNLAGLTSRYRKEIAVNPRDVDLAKEYGRYSKDELIRTLFHEFAHTRGYGEQDADEAEKLIPQRFLYEKVTK